jgi:hypothetical protein
MNTFYKFPTLPFDLSIYIHKQRQNTATNTIINSWFNYIARKVIAINLISRIVTSRDVIYNYNPYINYTDSRVACTLHYCNRVLSGNEDREWWTKKILQVISRLNYQINNNNICIYDEYPQKIVTLSYSIISKFYPTYTVPMNNNNYSYYYMNNLIQDLNNFSF